MVIMLRIAALAACLLLSSRIGQAQPPRQTALGVQRARDACDAAASRYGYRVLRRDRENVNGNQYQLPLHVSHGTTEADLTCRYDVNAGTADLPPWDDRNARVSRVPAQRRRNALSDAQFEARQMCERSINSRRGYQVVNAGTPVAHGARQWDVPLTVRRAGREDQTVTCRYNTANNKVTLR
jgi:hypothetical protein